VQAAFEDANKAAQDRERLINEGRAYANDVIPTARGTASRLLAEADGYKERTIASAEGDTSRFKQVLVEYAKAPQVTRERLYLETMQQIFTNTSKVLVDSRSNSTCCTCRSTGCCSRARRRAPTPDRRAVDARRAALGHDARAGVDEPRPRRAARSRTRLGPLTRSAPDEPHRPDPDRPARRAGHRLDHPVRRRPAPVRGGLRPRRDQGGHRQARPALQAAAAVPERPYFDNRILTIDTADVDRFITSEKLNVQIDTFVKWRIADPRRFFVSVGGSELVASDRLQRSLRDSLNNEVARKTSPT
jgi:hypothetical protein